MISPPELNGDVHANEHLRSAELQLGPKPERTAPWTFMWVQWLRAEIAAGSGNHVGVRDALDPLLAMPLMRVEEDFWRVLLLAARAGADGPAHPIDRNRRAGPGPSTKERMDNLARLGRETVSAGPLGVAWSAQLQAEQARFEGSDEPETWLAVVDGWEKTGQVHEKAWALTRCVMSMVRYKRTSGAAASLEEALAIAERLNARPLEEAALTVARRARIALRRPTARTGSQRTTQLRHGLTDRELEVLRLVADGQGNAEIASTLFISPKTVSVHVSRILAKLGVASRGQAAATALRQQLILPEE